MLKDSLSVGALRDAGYLHKTNYLEKPGTSTSTQYSANITSSYDLNMTQKLVRSVGGPMCTTHFKMDKTRSFTPSRSFFTPGGIYE